MAIGAWHATTPSHRASNGRFCFAGGGKDLPFRFRTLEIPNSLSRRPLQEGPSLEFLVRTSDGAGALALVVVEAHLNQLQPVVVVVPEVAFQCLIEQGVFLEVAIPIEIGFDEQQILVGFSERGFPLLTYQNQVQGRADEFPGDRVVGAGGRRRAATRLAERTDVNAVQD